MFKGHESEVNSAEFSPDGKRIVTAGDNTARIWLSPEGIIDWLGEQKNIYRLTNEDLKNLGIDFIELKE
jgi:WD40 repeat protein